MIQARLNDAAIALYKVFYEAQIKHGIFGGYAIGSLGGPRESKDIDCIAAVSKERAIAVLDGKEGFRFVDQTRDDYVAFLWSDHPKRERAVLVEIFVESFHGARFRMDSVEPIYKEVTGQAFGTQYTAHLDPVYIFKGKLRAAATRGKYHDSFDLRWLEENCAQALIPRKNEFNLQTVGLALKRYPELGSSFLRIGIDTSAAKDRAAALHLDKLPPPARGDVQKGLLAPGETSPLGPSFSGSSKVPENAKGKEKQDLPVMVEVNVSTWVKQNETIYEFDYNGAKYQNKASEWKTSMVEENNEACITYVGKKSGTTFWTRPSAISQKQIEAEVYSRAKGKHVTYEFIHDERKYSTKVDEWSVVEDAAGIGYLVYEGKSTRIKFWTYADAVKTKH